MNTFFHLKLPAASKRYAWQLDTFLPARSSLAELEAFHIQHLGIGAPRNRGITGMLDDLYHHGMFPTDFPFEGKQHKATAVTDFLSFGASRMGSNEAGPFFGLLMSPAAREVFCRFELGDHRWGEVSIDHKETTRSAFLLCYSNPLAPHVNWANSEFLAPSDSGDRVDVSGIEEYFQHLDNAGLVVSELSLSMGTTLTDLVAGPPVLNHPCVSQRLYAAIVDADLTGATFSPAPFHSI